MFGLALRELDADGLFPPSTARLLIRQIKSQPSARTT